MKNNRFVACILIPAFLFLGVFSIAPLFYGLGISLFRYNPLNQVNPFVGLENYRYMLSDPLFWNAAKNTVVFVALATVLNITITLFLAQVISTLPSNKLRGAFRTILFLPCIAPMVGSALVWRTGILNTSGGIFNEVLGWFGIAPINWLGNAQMIWPALIIFTLWAGIGYNVVLLSAGIDGIPSDFSEAAEIDGANAFQRFIYITMPLLGRTLTYVLMMTLIGFFQAFVQFNVLAQKGGPNHASEVLSLYVYNQGFINKDMGYASAVAFALFVLIFIVTTVQRRLNRVDWGY